MQAKATYEPQLEADQTQSAATHQANLNTLNTNLSSAGTTYDIQQQTLADTVKSQSAQISQLYATHLLGNFSGLQGNDMGAMFSKANQTSNNIETQRTNAINGINTAITNENLTYNASTGALISKYQGMEEDAASSAYNTAQKDYNTQQYQQQQLDLGYAKLNQSAYDSAAGRAQSASNAATTAQNNYLSGFKATSKSGGVGYSYVAPNGQSIDLGQYSMALTGGNTDNALQIIKSQLAQSQTTYDKSALALIGNTEKQGKSSSQILDQLSKQFSLDFSNYAGS